MKTKELILKECLQLDEELLPFENWTIKVSDVYNAMDLYAQQKHVKTQPTLEKILELIKDCAIDDPRDGGLIISDDGIEYLAKEFYNLIKISDNEPKR